MVGRHALTRGVGRSLGECELTFVERSRIHLPTAVEQHRAYCDALRAAGLSIEVLPPDPHLADSVFVEDTAVILEEVAIIARPASEVRRREVAAVARALEAHLPLARLKAPATLEGGDVLRLGRRLFVGLSTRTNRDGCSQLARLAAPHGYRVEPIAVHGCLHLKTAVTALDEETLLLNASWLETEALAGFDLVLVDESEPFAANTLSLGGVIHVSERWRRTRGLLEERGYVTRTLGISEFEKAEAGLTCLSLIL